MLNAFPMQKIISPETELAVFLLAFMNTLRQFKTALFRVATRSVARSELFQRAGFRMLFVCPAEFPSERIVLVMDPLAFCFFNPRACLDSKFNEQKLSKYRSKCVAR